MCRNIKTLFNFAPPANEDEIRAAALQFVRKLTGYNKPSKENEIAFFNAVNEITNSSRLLFNSLRTNAEPKDRETEAQKAKLRNLKRFGINN